MEFKPKWIIVGAVLGVLIVSVTILSVILSQSSDSPIPEYLDSSRCPSDYSQHPVISISLDGFRPDFLKRGLTPTLQQLAKSGVATTMISSYPTVTFPNHYTIATGLYPESHGIIANIFSDPEFNALFRLGTEESLKRRWWGGEPIWSTLRRQNQISASYFWPGSETVGMYPNYYTKYDSSVPFEDRVEQVLNWLKLPKDERPSWISFYMNEPDHTAHVYGPNTTQVDDQLVRVDGAIRQLLTGIHDLGLTHCVNIIITSDHGVTTTGIDKVIDLDDYSPGIKNKVKFFRGTFSRFNIRKNTEGLKAKLLQDLACKHEGLRAYQKTDLPIRYHFINNRRIEDVVLDMDDGYSAQISSTWSLNGTHGYDNIYPLMHSIFIGYGVDIRHSMKIPSFQNIEIYNLLCDLLGVKPAPNNGTAGVLHHVLKKPPTFNASFQGSPPKLLMATAEDLIIQNDVSTSCAANIPRYTNYTQDFIDLNNNVSSLSSTHLPFGAITYTNDNDYLLLTQPHFLTGYSSRVKSPLWSSSYITKIYNNNQEYNNITWYKDPRLEDQINCDEDVTLDNCTRTPLIYPNFHTKDSKDYLSFLTTSSFYLSHQLKPVWDTIMLKYIPDLVKEQGYHLNIITGPVRNKPTTTTNAYSCPSHVFLIIIRCKNSKNNLKNCSEKDLDVLSFLLPQDTLVQNCMETKKFMLKHTCTIKDIEGVTNLQFFTTLSPYQRIRLLTKVTISLW